MRSRRKARASICALDWASRTRWTNFGLAPEILLGPTDARNLVVRY
ncbi:hypothetical protein ACX9MK_09645 [Corynebacterium evansiae]